MLYSNNYLLPSYSYFLLPDSSSAMARGLRGVKDDLSEIGRHLLDIACFLSPFFTTTYADSPPSSPHSPNPNSRDSRPGDLPEAGGVFRSGMSRLSSVFRRPGVGKERDSGGRGGGLGGVREEVVGFVRDLVKCPESWVEFPFPVDDHFDMSLDQKEHIAIAERLTPSLAALRISLCPSFMNEESFWKIYFTLLHPKLNKHESEFLSTQQARHLIVEEMHMNLMKKMQDRESKSHIPVAENSTLIMSSKVCEIEEEDSEVPAPLPSTETTSLQYIDRWFERSVPGEMDASTYNRPQVSSKDKSEADDDSIVMLKKYKSSSSFEAASLGNSPFSSYERLQLLENTYSQDYHEKPHRKLQSKQSTDEEKSSWHNAGEDSSDFEIVDRS
ncbi:uncharacterized protein M6B38_155985 [Iris pallida]|uniref:BSD domain-containing protein n=1 Tax=Iris pallida TaxID=29817 RepID=A0AAX6F474_IRIPA|nr:uncharacterized protein M6B38_155985 [Iris pallida]